MLRQQYPRRGRYARRRQIRIRPCARQKWIFGALVSGTLLLTSPATLAVEPLGNESQVNTYTTGDQLSAAVASADDGSFVVVWQSDGADDSTVKSILAQRFDSTGTALGDEIRVDTSTLTDNTDPAVGMAGNGAFVVVWHEPGYLPGTSLLRGRRLAADGTPEPSFQANTGTASGARSGEVAVADDGSFVVAWDDLSVADGDGRGILARRFDANGAPLSSPFQVNTYTTGEQTNPAVGIATGGDFVIAWQSPGASDSSTESVLAQRFAADGMSAGGELRINQFTGDVNREPSVAIGTGEFVVVWTNPAFLPGTTNIAGRRFASDGTPNGQFQVNAGTINSARSPSAVLEEDGRLVVAWDNNLAPSDPEGRGTEARVFSVADIPQSALFQVNTSTDGDQDGAAVSAGGLDNLIVTWVSDSSSGTDSSQKSIQMQSYRLPLFADGFESRDTSVWSRSQGAASN